MLKVVLLVQSYLENIKGLVLISILLKNEKKILEYYNICAFYLMEELYLTIQ
jgi:hypothetical protein